MSHVQHVNEFMSHTWTSHNNTCVLSQLWMRDEWVMHHMWMRSTGWRRPIGCHKLQVIFGKRGTNYGGLLRKMTCKDKASYGSSPPCTMHIYHNYECVVAHIWMSHVPHMNKSCHTYEWVMSLDAAFPTFHINDLFPAYDIWMMYFPHINAVFPTCE